MRFLAAVALLSSSLACASCASIPKYDFKAESKTDPNKAEFLIGHLDQLSVAVWNHRELSADVVVRPDGVITLPLIGDVKAADRTPSQLRTEVTTRLKDFVMEELVVAVGIVAVNSYQFTIIGSVEHSGMMTSRSYLSIVEALAMAGGPNRFAGNYLYILRDNPQRRIPIDIRRATSGEHPDENLLVRRGDVIVVP